VLFRSTTTAATADDGKNAGEDSGDDDMDMGDEKKDEDEGQCRMDDIVMAW
jgi:hypothetical protein